MASPKPRLTDSETAQLISALLSQAVLPAEVHAALLERAGGNPLYAEEFIRMLSDQGVLQRKGRILVLDPEADIPMPDNVQALLAARLDTLPAERKSLLHAASVAGKVFWSGAVAALNQCDDREVTEGLHELARKELVRPARTSSIEGQQEYSISESPLQEVIAHRFLVFAAKSTASAYGGRAPPLVVTQMNPPGSKTGNNQEQQ